MFYQARFTMWEIVRGCCLSFAPSNRRSASKGLVTEVEADCARVHC